MDFFLALLDSQQGITKLPFLSFFSDRISDSNKRMARRYARKNESKIIRELERKKKNNIISEEEYLESLRDLQNIIAGKY